MEVQYLTLLTLHPAIHVSNIHTIHYPLFTIRYSIHNLDM